MTAATTRVTKMPKGRCKAPQNCQLCPIRIKAGQRVAKDFDTKLWVHLGCLVRKINAPRDDVAP